MEKSDTRPDVTGEDRGTRLQKALDLWVELTGIDPSATTFNVGDWPIHKANKDIKEALDLDESQVTACLLLDYFAEQHFSKRNFSVPELLEFPEKTGSYLQKAK